jgi:hypothetical protein
VQVLLTPNSEDHGAKKPTTMKMTFGKPPMEPDNIVALAWASLATFSSDPNKQTVGKEVIQQMQSMLNDYPLGSQDRLYLIHLNNLFLNSVRSLSNRLDGMTQYFQLSSDVEKAKRTQAQELGNISGDVTSLIPRIGASAGGLSIVPIIAKVANISIPSVGGLSGYEILLFGAFLGYLAAEFFLRLYSFLAVPRIIQSAQFERHLAYNKFLREAKEVLTNLTINAIRLREQFYPDAGTISSYRFYYGATADIDSKRKLAYYVNDLVDRVTPAIHDDIILFGKLIRSKARYVRRLTLDIGDVVVGSYSVEGARRVDVFLVREFPPVGGKIDVLNCEYYNLDSSAGEFRIFIRKQGQYGLVFENKSRLRVRRMIYSSQVIKGDSLDLLPRKSQ